MAIWRGSVNTLAELQALDTTHLNENLAVFVKDQEKWYFWDSTSTEAIDSPNVVGRSQDLLSTSLSDALVFLELEETGQPFVDVVATSNFNEQTNTVVSQVAAVRNNGIEFTANGNDVGLVAINKFEVHTNTDSTINFWWKWTELPGNPFSGTIIEVTDSYKLEFIAGSFRLETDDGVGTSLDINADDPVALGIDLTQYVMVTILWDHDLRRTTVIMNLVGITELETTIDPQVQAGNNLQLFPDSTDGDHSIDHLGIWNRRLSPTEIQRLYLGGAAYPISATDIVAGRWKIVSAGSGETVKVSANDTTTDFLINKLTAGSNITLTELNDGANEDLEISASDELAKVTANDTTPDYLLSKIVAGTGITINEINDGANETLEIVSTGSGAASRILLSAENSINFTHNATPNLKDLILDTATVDPEAGYNNITGEYTVASDALVLVIVQIRLDGTAVASRKYVSIQLDTGGGYNDVAIGDAYTDGANDTDNTWRAIIPLNVTAGNTIKAQHFTTVSSTFSSASSDSFLQIVELKGETDDKTVKVSVNDTTPNFLLDKLVAGAGITLTEINDGGDEDLQIALTGGVGLQQYTGATSSIADQASEDVDITTGTQTKFAVARIQTSVEGLVRLYTNKANRTADAARGIGVPAPSSIRGLVAEVETGTGDLIIDLSNLPNHVNLEAVQVAEIYATIFNLSGVANIVTVDIFGE